MVHSVLHVCKNWRRWFLRNPLLVCAKWEQAVADGAASFSSFILQEYRFESRISAQDEDCTRAVRIVSQIDHEALLNAILSTSPNTPDAHSVIRFVFFRPSTSLIAHLSAIMTWLGNTQAGWARFVGGYRMLIRFWAECKQDESVDIVQFARWCLLRECTPGLASSNASLLVRGFSPLSFYSYL